MQSESLRVMRMAPWALACVLVCVAAARAQVPAVPAIPLPPMPTSSSVPALPLPASLAVPAVPKPNDKPANVAAAGVPAIPTIPVPVTPAATTVATTAPAQAAAEKPAVTPPPIPGAADTVTKTTDVPVVPPPMPGGGDKVAGVPAIPALPGAATNTAKSDAPAPPPLTLPGMPIEDPMNIVRKATGNKAEGESEGAEKEEDTESLASRIKASPNGIVLPPPVKLPPVHEVQNRPKTWHKKLKPVVTPRRISHNYKNQVLFAPLSMASYDRDNQHLPPALSRETYSTLLLQTVASNDINGTRALLDSGVSPNTRSTTGESALMVAQRAGAEDTARLLMARGAR